MLTAAKSPSAPSQVWIFSGRAVTVGPATVTGGDLGAGTAGVASTAPTGWTGCLGSSTVASAGGAVGELGTSGLTATAGAGDGMPGMPSGMVSPLFGCSVAGGETVSAFGVGLKPGSGGNSTVGSLISGGFSSATARLPGIPTLLPPATGPAGNGGWGGWGWLGAPCWASALDFCEGSPIGVGMTTMGLGCTGNGTGTAGWVCAWETNVCGGPCGTTS